VSVTLLSVNFDLLYLGLGLVLLWFPRQWLRYGAFRGRVRGQRSRGWAPNRDREPGDLSVWLGEETAKMRNWVDFFRALAGGAAVGGTLFPAVAAITAAGPRPDALTVKLILGLKLFVLLIGLAVQMFRLETKLSLFAPIFYIQGLAFGLIGVKAALVAIILAWVANALLPSAAVLLTVFGCLEVIAALFFHAPRQATFIAGGLSVLPVLVSILLKRRLAQFTKRTKIIAGPSSSAG
jgi:hypothetical protein